MSGAAPAAIGALVALVVVIAGVLGLADITGDAYLGLGLLLAGLAALAWGREGGPS